MALDHLGVSFNGVGPESDGLVSGARSNDLAIGRNAEVIDWPLVPNKAVRAESRLEVPNH
jgi:hypothetical protein